MSFSHLDQEGRARMVDVSGKKRQRRVARAAGRVTFSAATAAAIQRQKLPKGNPFEVARIAGIQAAKETARLIPLCHNLPLDAVDVDVQLHDDHFEISSTVVCQWATGVEMEALTAVAATALTLYDMCKAVDKEMRIEGIHLVEKRKESL